MFGPYVVGQPTPYPLGKYKAKFDTTKPIVIAMFSDPIIMYSGPWPSNDAPIVTPNLAGHHKFLVFGTAPDGSSIYDGCETDSKNAGPTDSNGDGIPDDLAVKAQNEEFGTCTTFGPYRLGVPTPYPLGLYKDSFDRSKPIVIAMFSDPVVLYSGAWPSDDKPLISPNLPGHHKFVVFGTGPDGTPTYDGCEHESVTTSTSTTTNVQAATQTPAKTGANLGSLSFIGGALLVIGALLVLFFGRRRDRK